MRPLIILAILFGNAAFQTWLAWEGSKVALIMLAVSTVAVAVFMTIHARGWRDALEGWKRSTEGWEAAQTWGMKQDTILRDALRDLYEYDEEAAEIHGGRSRQASFDYLVEVDSPSISAAVLDELRKGHA